MVKYLTDIKYGYCDAVIEKIGFNEKKLVFYIAFYEVFYKTTPKIYKCKYWAKKN